jgi:WD40 repeat protein
MFRYFSIVVLCAALPSLLGADEVSFVRDIRPILNRSCAGCHQPASKQSGLLVNSYQDLLAGGSKGPSLVAGAPDKSLIISYLTGDRQPSMPFGMKPLPAEQIDLFRRWIAAGAKDDTPSEILTARKETVYSAPPLVTALAFSPDGKLLAVSGYHEILLHEYGGKLLARLPGASMRIHSIAFSPDGKTLAAVGGDPAQRGELQIWDVASRRQTHSSFGSTDTFFGLSFSPDGSKVAFAGADKSIRLHDVATGKEIRRMDHHEDWVFATIFGQDGKRLVSVSRDRAAKLTDTESGRFIENVNLLREPLTALARHPRKDWVLVGGADRIPYLYKMDRPRAMRIADDSTLIRKFPQQDGPILALAISQDGQWVAVGAESGDVHIYNLETAELAAKCTGHQGGIYALQFHPNNKELLAAGFDGMVRSYKLDGQLLKAFSPVPLSSKTEVAP